MLTFTSIWPYQSQRADQKATGLESPSPKEKNYLQSNRESQKKFPSLFDDPNNPSEKPDTSNIDALLFRLCTRKCIERTNINLKGDAINHTIYECFEHCGSKF